MPASLATGFVVTAREKNGAGRKQTWNTPDYLCDIGGFIAFDDEFTKEVGLSIADFNTGMHLVPANLSLAKKVLKFANRHKPRLKKANGECCKFGPLTTATLTDGTLHIGWERKEDTIPESDSPVDIVPENPSDESSEDSLSDEEAEIAAMIAADESDEENENA